MLALEAQLLDDQTLPAQSPQKVMSKTCRFSVSGKSFKDAVLIEEDRTYDLQVIEV